MKTFSTSGNNEYIDPIRINQVMTLAINNDNAFYIKFLELFPDFNQKLLHINPELIISDLEYCALLRLNFSNKQIAQFKRISVRAVESKKYRLRKKLNIDSKANIYIWMLNL